jgi:hypothetical protein
MPDSISYKRISQSLIFVLLLLIIALFYKYPEIAFKRPQSIHNWRQSDCASITLNYYQNGMRFFQPEIHGLISNGFTSGKAATSEIPLFYYTIAILYKGFGYHDYIYRIINTLIFFFGLYSLFRCFSKLHVNIFWSIGLSLLFFASPVLAYYGNNFLTDITAFSLSLIGWNFFISYNQQGRGRDFFLSVLFFFLGMSMKISAGISVICLVGLYILESLPWIKFKTGIRNFSTKILTFLPFIIALILVGAWALYARNYNIRNACGYFSTTIYPLWEMTEAEIAKTLEHMRVLWLNEYFHRYTLFFFSFLFLLNIIHIKKANRLLIASNITILIGTVLYAILWFATFKDHDYYTINLFILPVITTLTFAEYMNRLYPKFSGNLLIKGIIIFILIFNVIHTRNQLNIRYNGWWNEYPAFKDFDTVTPYLRSIGIERHERVISIPDQSHHTLYLMNQPGWTECFHLNLDSASMQQSVNRGAKYLIIASQEDLDARPYLNSFTSELTGKYGKILIYNLQAQ